MKFRITAASQLTDDFYSVRSSGQNVRDIVIPVLHDVRTHGDNALHSYALKFDKSSCTSFEISTEDLESCASAMKKKNPSLYDAICYSRDLTLAFARLQRQSFTDFEAELVPGMITGQKTIPVDRAGLYVPAGRFPLLSSVIMCSAPARAAGVRETILCTPPRPHPSGDASKPWADENILAAAFLCGIDRVFAAGGAQAVAAMAYGTESIPRADVIAGPGNKFVAEAKRQVYGDVGIDLVAGPTEVFIIADDSADPAWVAADLLAQAEHDADAQAVLVTTSQTLADKVNTEVEKQLAKLATAATAAASIEKAGVIIIADSFEQAAAIAEKKAPEHLELAMRDGIERDTLQNKLRNYGSLFIGHHSAEVLGDYAAGLNHTLPTSGSARFTGGLSVRFFLKTVTTLRTLPQAAENGTRHKPAAGGREHDQLKNSQTAGSALDPIKNSQTAGSALDPITNRPLIGSARKSAETAVILGEAEGLAGHAQAARCRVDYL